MKPAPYTKKVKKIAALVSTIFEPMTVLTLITLVGSFLSGLSFMAIIRFDVVFLFVMVLPAFLLRLIALKEGWVSNWDITNRKERIKPMLVFGIIIGTSLIFDWWFGNSFLVRLFALYTVWFFGFFLITIFWKISGHVGIFSLACFLLFSWFGLPALLVFPLIGLVSWARIVHHDHTIMQTCIATFYSASVVLFFSLFF